MATFLELCNRLHERTGESGADLTTVVAQTGYRKRLVNYVKNAWVDIQSRHVQWRFLRKPALPTIVATDSSVDADAWVSTNLSTNIAFIHKNTFSIYETALGTSDESKLIYIEPENWKDLFGISYNNGIQDRPRHVSLDPDTSNIIFGPTSDDAYTFHFEFQATPEIWSVDADTLSGVSTDMHDIVFWRALMFYAMAEEDTSTYKEARSQYKIYLNRLRLRYLPKVSIGEPLA